jgi:uncharacterized GH25 family protein
MKPIAALLSLTVSQFVLIAPACAHDVWISFAGEPSARVAIVNYGHPNDRPPSFADKIVDADAISSNGKVALTGFHPMTVDGYPVVGSAPFADNERTLLSVRYDNGLWVKLPDGSYRNATKRLVPNAVECIWSVKFGKAFTGPGSAFNTELGHDLEIIPLNDPAAIKRGETLAVKILYRGKPLAGAEVERGDGKTVVPEKDIPKFRSDEQGVARIPIVQTGPHLLVIDYRTQPSLSPEQADADLFNATIWFSVAE